MRKQNLFIFIALVMFFTGNTLIAQTPLLQEGNHSGILKIACVGDSITYGTGLDQMGRHRETDCYPALLRAMLGERYQVENFGRPGARVRIVSKNPYIGSKEYKDALAFNPDVVIIALGINDTVDNPAQSDFMNNYQQLIDAFKALPSNPKIWIGSLMPINVWKREFTTIYPLYDIVGPWIEQIAKNNRLTLIDLYEPLHRHPEVFWYDAIHPDEEGLAILAKTVYRAITGNYGDLSLPFIFSNNMVLQRDLPIPVFGTATVGEQITVTLGDSSKSAITNENGKWRIAMPPMSAGGPFTMTIQGNTKISLSNVLTGDVWVCAGQSNMDWSLDLTDHAHEDIADANHYPNIRILNLSGKPGGRIVFSQDRMDQTEVETYYEPDGWNVANSTTVGPFSGVGYLYGKYLHQNLKIPIGLIDVAIGGTMTESFIDIEKMEKEKVLWPIYPKYRDTDNWTENPMLSDWCRNRAKLNLKNWLEAPVNPMPHHPYEPGFLFEAGIKPMIPLGIKGAIWYQGESNAPNSGDTYPVDYDFQKTLLTKMVESWREAWGQGDFPFYYVQLPNYCRDWMEYRQLQLELLDIIPESGMAVSIGVGDPKTVHPIHKRTVSERLAKWALAKTYGKDIVFSGPLYKSMTLEGNSIKISFDHAGSGLTTSDGQNLRGFEISGPDGIFTEANAVIIGNDIFVSNPSVSQPEQVRYAWAPDPDGNLMNKEGLPASPFRTPQSIQQAKKSVPKISEGVIMFKDLFNTSMREGVSCYRIPSIVTAPNGDLVTAIDERVPSCSDLHKNRNINIVMRRSTDDGMTWSEIETVADYPDGQSASDPSMIVDRGTGEIFLFYNFMDLDKEPGVYYLHVIKSSDNGKSWSEAQNITDQITKPEWKNDFKFITSGCGIQTRSGTLLHTLVNLDKGLHLFGSSDHGKTWFFIDTPITPGDESKIVELADGCWMINSRVKNTGMRYVHISTDQGKTWKTTPEPALIDPGCNASIIRYTSIEDGYKKNRLLFSNAKSPNRRENMTVRVSYDEGQTWTEGKTIYSGGSAYSSLTVLENGEIGLLFEKDGYQENAFVRFSLEWLTNGEDRYEKPKTDGLLLIR